MILWIKYGFLPQCVLVVYLPSASTGGRQITKVGRSHRTERLPVLQSGGDVRAEGGRGH